MRRALGFAATLAAGLLFAGAAAAQGAGGQGDACGDLQRGTPEYQNCRQAMQDGPCKDLERGSEAFRGCMTAFRTGACRDHPVGTPAFRECVRQHDQGPCAGFAANSDELRRCMQEQRGTAGTERRRPGKGD